VDVNAVATRIAGSLERMLGSNIRVALALDEHIEPIRIGVSQLEEILLNLGAHARSAMPNGGRLTVATAMHPRDAPAGSEPKYVRLIVNDNGGGMSAAAQARLFEPFFDSDDAGADAVGLAKVDAIVKHAGGRIQVESAPGAGTTFTIDLPAMAAPMQVASPVFAETRLGTPVLVVEDEPRVRELVRLVLVRAGHEVVAVAGPHAALAALQRQPSVALMLVDVVMPEMDGYDLVAEARTISPGIHVVFMSGFAPDAARHPSGDAFLAKPFTIESLTSIVQRALDA
jgi:two-component system cell cycle sensor histidine kinase/response regulator CckA